MPNQPIHARFFSDALEGDGVQVHSVAGRESLGRLFEFDVLLSTTDTSGLSVEGLLDRAAALVFARGDEVLRTVRGVVAEVEDLGQTEAKFVGYRLKLVPRIWGGTLNKTLDVHLDATVPELVTQKLLACGLDAARIELRLQGAYPKRDFIVQYKETDHAFWSRLLEHWGITLFFEEDDEDVRVVLGDHNDAFGRLPEGAGLPFQARGDHLGVSELRALSRPLPKRYVVRDYNYRTPMLDLCAVEDATVPGKGREAAEYGTHFKTLEEGAAFAKVRAQESLCRQTIYNGKSNVVGMRAGARFLLEGHPKGDVELLVTEVKHHHAQIALGGAGGEVGYRNEFVAIPSSATFRPERTTPVPKVSGVLTGRVEASATSNYAELDDDGRYKVRFLFDAAETAAAQASHAVRMLQPHSGPGYGMHFPMRSGIEVALTFVDGDPDRPVIVGTVPNASTGNPVTATNNTHNVIRTGGGNYIDIDDKSDAERIKLGTPRLNTIFQLGAPNAGEDGVLTSTLGNSSTIATTSISGITSLSTSVTLFQKLQSAGDIISFASKPSKKEQALVGLSLVDTVASIATTSLDVTMKVMSAVQAQKDGDAQVAQFAVDEKSAAADAATKVVDDSLAALAADTSLSQAARDDLAAKKAAYDAQGAALATAQTALATAQDAFNDVRNKKDIMGLAVDGAILAKRADLVTAWFNVLVALERLDGDTLAPVEGALEPVLHQTPAHDVGLVPPSEAVELKKQRVFSDGGGDPSADAARDLVGALDALPGGKGAAAASALATAKTARQDKQDALAAYAAKKRDAGWGTLNMTQGFHAKNLAKASLAFNGIRTATALISAITGLFNLAKSTEEQVKNQTSWEKLGAQLTSLGLKTLAAPATTYTPLGFCPPEETTNLSGSAGSMGLYAYERLFCWSPEVATMGDRVLIVAGDIPDFTATPPTFQPNKPVAIHMVGQDGTLELRAEESVDAWSKVVTVMATAAKPPAPPTAFQSWVADSSSSTLTLTSQADSSNVVKLVLDAAGSSSFSMNTLGGGKETAVLATEGNFTVAGSEGVLALGGESATGACLDLVSDGKVELSSAQTKALLVMKSDSSISLKNDKAAELGLSASEAKLLFKAKGVAVVAASTTVSGKTLALKSDGKADITATGPVKVNGAKVLLG